MKIPLNLISEAAVEKAILPSVPFPTRRREVFIKQFEGPGADSGVVCFRYFEMAPVWGCPYRCAYCFLQTNPYVRFNREALAGLIYTNWPRMLNELEEWLTATTPRTLIVGELQDGLAFDNAYARVTGKPLTHHLIPLFASQQRHELIVLTKSTLISPALQLPATPQVIFSWSVNAEYVGRRWEQGASLPSRRFDAARKMKAAGWRVRFRLDPMLPYRDEVEDWQTGYAYAIEQINGVEPEMVTLGTLRATNKNALASAAKKNGRPTDLFAYLSEKDPSGFKYRLPRAQQLELYRFALERLNKQHIVPALCKEEASLWRELGLTFNGCHCLRKSPVVAQELVSSTSFQQLKSPAPAVRSDKTPSSAEPADGKEGTPAGG